MPLQVGMDAWIGASRPGGTVGTHQGSLAKLYLEADFSAAVFLFF